MADISEEREPNYEHVVSQPLLDEWEQPFFELLQSALPQFHIFPQIAFLGIMQPREGLEWADKARVLGYISRKRFDFLVCRRDTLEVVANIELDGKRHERRACQRSDEKRDKLIEAAGYKVYRFSWRRLPTQDQITQLFGQM